MLYNRTTMFRLLSRYSFQLKGHLFQYSIVVGARSVLGVVTGGVESGMECEAAGRVRVDVGT